MSFLLNKWIWFSPQGDTQLQSFTHFSEHTLLLADLPFPYNIQTHPWLFFGTDGKCIERKNISPTFDIHSYCVDCQSLNWKVLFIVRLFVWDYCVFSLYPFFRDICLFLILKYRYACLVLGFQGLAMHHHVSTVHKILGQVFTWHHLFLVCFIRKYVAPITLSASLSLWWTSFASASLTMAWKVCGGIFFDCLFFQFN